MTQLDTELRQAALDLVAEFGADVAFTVQALEYDPASGKSWPSSTVTHSWKCGPPDAFETVLGKLVARQDSSLGLIVPAQGIPFEPSITGQTATIGGKVYRITKVAPVYSGAQVAIYLLELAQ